MFETNRSEVVHRTTKRLLWAAFVSLMVAWTYLRVETGAISDILLFVALGVQAAILYLKRDDVSKDEDEWLNGQVELPRSKSDFGRQTPKDIHQRAS